MGGYNSGRYGGRPTSEATNSFVLNIAALKRAKVLRRGILCLLTFTFDDFRRELPVSIRLDLRDDSNCYAELTHATRSTSAEAEQITYRIRLTTTRPHFGGERWWFICPRRGALAAKLYLPLGGRQFWSRSGYSLGYACQRESRRDRLMRRARKLNYRLGGNGALGDVPDKPKGMHWRTYEGKAAALVEAERRVDDSLLLLVARLEARHGRRRAKG
jgi:hypothetical protein